MLTTPSLHNVQFAFQGMDIRDRYVGIRRRWIHLPIIQFHFQPKEHETMSIAMSITITITISISISTTPRGDNDKDKTGVYICVEMGNGGGEMDLLDKRRMVKMCTGIQQHLQYGMPEMVMVMVMVMVDEDGIHIHLPYSSPRQ